jgi:DNA helicase-2/ATP-dependent DNA helicase PcrA
MTPNADQLLAIYGHKGRPTAKLRVIIAGPGAGKTFTLVETVKAVAPMSVIAVMTFTNGAAHELVKRLGDIELAYIGTTHGYCFKLIQRYGDRIGYRSGEVVLLPDAERIPRILAVRDQLGIKVSQEKLFDPKLSFDPAVARAQLLIMAQYRSLLKQSNLVDFDSILSEGVALLQLDEVRAAVSLDYLFVDERQDSNVVEHQIFVLIPANHKFFVGDPDQSIYEWRGADPWGLVELTQVESAEVVKLELNYRSDKAICRAASQLIAHNERRVHKLVKPVSSENGGVLVKRFANVFEELEFLAGQIRTLLMSQKDPSIAVLYRLNFEVKRAYAYLISASLPVTAPQLLASRPPDWERAVLLLSLAVSPDNEILAERYLKLDHDAKQVERWLLEARADGKPIAERVARGWVSGPAGRMTQGDAYRGDWFRLLAANKVSESTIGLIKQRAELLPPDSNISDLVRDLYQHEDLREPDKEDGIYIGTMHSAKGREWDVAFLPAFEQGIIPSRAAADASNDPRHGDTRSVIDSGLLEQERRLAFVALTRARHIVYISHCANRKGQWGPEQEMEPSMFIKEMGL